MFSGAALLIAATWFSYNLFSSRDAELPPRIINSITVEPAILLAGKPFTLHINVTLNRLCPSEVHWSLARKGDNVEVVKIIEPIKAPPDTLGTQNLPPILRYVPSAVEPGEYRYIAEVFDQCPGNRSVTSVKRTVDISVR
jgi:hypothetical protein